MWMGKLRRNWSSQLLYVFPVAVDVSYWQSTNMHLTLNTHMKGGLPNKFARAKIHAVDGLLHVYLQNQFVLNTKGCLRACLQSADSQMLSVYSY